MIITVFNNLYEAEMLRYRKMLIDEVRESIKTKSTPKSLEAKIILYMYSRHIDARRIDVGFSLQSPEHEFRFTNMSEHSLMILMQMLEYMEIMSKCYLVDDMESEFVHAADKFGYVRNPIKPDQYPYWRLSKKAMNSLKKAEHK